MRKRSGRCLGLAFFLAAAVAAVRGYDLSGHTWPSGSIPLQLQLGPAPRTLLDGATHWDDVAIGAVQAWNAVLSRSQFTYVKNSTAAKARANGFNNVFFDSTTYGEEFGDRVLAVTLLRSTSSRFVETDVVVNSGRSWDSYRSTLRSAMDLQRVLVHEFGHALGLDHPDQAAPAQEVSAIMNSTVSNVAVLQPDDIAGIQSLYGAISGGGGTVGALANQSVRSGSSVTLELKNVDAGVTRYAWTFTRPGGTPTVLRDGDGEAVSGTSYSLFSAQPEDAGTYTVAAVTGTTTLAAISATLSVTAVSTADARMANISARGRAGTGSDTFIVGFVINGATPKSILLRAIGPTLATQGVGGPASDPRLKLMRMTGGTTTVGENDNWSGNATQAAILRAAAQRLGAFALPDGSRDAALLVTLSPGVYTAQVEVQEGAAGVALLEVYDADATRSAALVHRLINVSTRTYAGTGDEQLFAGFVVDGSTPKQVLVRAVGPALASQGVSGANPDPYVVLYKGQTVIATNDDWSVSNQSDVLASVAQRLGAFALPAGGKDSALLITLAPGVYSVKVSGRHGETGVVLLELYEVAN